MSTVTVIVGGGSAPNVRRAQEEGFGRSELLCHDPGVLFSSNENPGEEIIYVLAGSLEYQVEGRAPVMLTAGDVLFIPARTID